MEAIFETLKCIPLLIIRHPASSAIAGTGMLLYMCRCYYKSTAGVCTLDQDMTGKTVLITGATTPIGKATAYDLACRNATVIMASKDFLKAHRLAGEIIEDTGNENVMAESLDLSSFYSVRECARSILNKEENLHVLINNAGIVDEQGQLTADGCEINMQANHFGHFLLTTLLIGILKKSAPSRIINVSSAAHKHAKLDLNNLNKKLPVFEAYSNSKLATILFTLELSKRLRGTGVTVNTVDPGRVKTNVDEFGTNPLTIIVGGLFNLFSKTPESAAQTIIQAAIDPSLQRTSGKYFIDCKERKPSRAGRDEADAKRLFEESEKATRKIPRYVFSI